MEEVPIKSRVIKCEHCKHFVFQDTDVKYCTNCGEELIVVVDTRDIPPVSKSWLSLLFSWFKRQPTN